MRNARKGFKYGEILTAKYAKYAKKMRMQRNAKYDFTCIQTDKSVWFGGS